MNGKVELEGDLLTEGSGATVISTEDGETFEISPDEERALHAAIAQADRGEVMSWDDVMTNVRTTRRAE